MNKSKIEHRNKVLRQYFEGRDWDLNGGFSLKRKLVLESKEFIPNYPYIIEDEWEVEPGRTDQGRGDLVFTDGSGCFAVVEVKWLDLESTERTASTKKTSNRKKRRKVEEQALKYAAAYYNKIASSKPDDVKYVEAFWLRNEGSSELQLETVEKVTGDNVDSYLADSL